jgi:hypothetical protein
MATIRQYYDADFKGFFGPEGTLPLEYNDGRKLDDVPIWKILLSFDSRSMFLVYYVSQSADSISICHAAIENYEWVLNIKRDLSIISRFADGVSHSLDDCVFTRRLIIYVDLHIPEESNRLLNEHAQKYDLALVLRDHEYLKHRECREMPLAFISHDWRDKADIAKPLAINLSQNLCPVWYDEFSLQVGDSLREKIEKGLKECKRCVLILTPNFLSNEGWARREFDSIFTRELVEKQNLLLPVWSGVTDKDVFNFSPILRDRVAIDWSLGVEEVTKRLLKVLL